MYKQCIALAFISLTLGCYSTEQINQNQSAPPHILQPNNIQDTENTSHDRPTKYSIKKWLAPLSAAAITTGLIVKKYLTPEKRSWGLFTKKGYNLLRIISEYIPTEKETIEDFSNVQHKRTLHLYGVYDGHGGPLVAEQVANHLNKKILDKIARGANPQDALTQSYIEIDADLPNHLPREVCTNQGTTAVTALVSEDKIIVANTGDSRALLVCSKGMEMPLSDDHKPTREDERKRIISAGGKLDRCPGLSELRVDRDLAMSRSIGDHRFIYSPEKRSVIPDPEINIRQRSEHDLCIVLASDGLWDVVENHEVDRIVKAVLSKGATLDQVASSLGNTALSLGSQDDITVLIVPLKDHYPNKKQTSRSESKLITDSPFSRNALILSTTAASMFITALYYSFAPKSVAATQ